MKRAKVYENNITSNNQVLIREENKQIEQTENHHLRRDYVQSHILHMPGNTLNQNINQNRN